MLAGGDPRVRAALRRLQHHTRQAQAAAGQLERYAGEPLAVYTLPAGTPVVQGELLAWLQLVAEARPQQHVLTITVHSGSTGAAEEAAQHGEDSRR